MITISVRNGSPKNLLTIILPNLVNGNIFFLNFFEEKSAISWKWANYLNSKW